MPFPFCCCCKKVSAPKEGRRYRRERKKSEEIRNEIAAAEANAMGQEGMSDLERLRTMSNAKKMPAPGMLDLDNIGSSTDDEVAETGYVNGKMVRAAMSLGGMDGADVVVDDDRPKEGYIPISAHPKVDEFGQPFYESYTDESLEADILKLLDMGYLNEVINRRALQETGGHIDKALEFVVAAGGAPGSPGNANSTSSFDFNKPAADSGANTFVEGGGGGGGSSVSGRPLPPPPTGEEVAPVRRESSDNGPPPILPAKTTAPPRSLVPAPQSGVIHIEILGTWHAKYIGNAVKLLKMTAKIEDRDEFIRECEAMLALRGADNLCQVLGVSVRRRPWLCIIELLKYGDANQLLKTCIAKSLKVNLAELLYMAQQVANGMSFMETKGWIHMDLAARNVLVHSGLVCKVADFGLSRMVEPITRHHVITKQMKLPVKWLAIESMISKTFSIETDVWAFGVTAWEFFAYGEMPFKGTPNAHVLGFLEEGTRLDQKDNCPDDVFALLRSTWNADPKDRPTFTECADQLQAMCDQAGGVMNCRDIGFELKGGRRRLPSEAASEMKQNTITARKTRLSLMMSDQISNAAQPMGYGASISEAEVALDLNGTPNAKGYINGSMINDVLAKTRTLSLGKANVECTYQNGRCKYKQDSTTPGPFCTLHTCTGCAGPKRSAETICGNCAISEL